MPRTRNLVCWCLLAIAAPTFASAQGGGVVSINVGLTYDLTAPPSVAVVPVKGGPYADSLAAIVQRDLTYSNRLTNLPLNASDVGLFYDAFKGLSYEFFAGLNAQYVIEMTATQSRLSVKVHDIAKHRPVAAADFDLPTAGLGRGWRQAVHVTSDSVLALITGARGIAATRIAYTRGQAGQTLRVIDSDGAFDISVPIDSNATSPSWSPSGDHLVFNTFGTDNRIVQVDLRNGQSTTVRKNVNNATLLAAVYTPDGKSIMYGKYDDDGSTTLWRQTLGTTDAQRIERSKGINTNPSLSPDGRRVAFTTDRLGHDEVYIVDVDGSNSTWITQIAGDLNEKTYRSDPAWSPDGITIALQSRVNDRFQIMTVNLRDNLARFLTDAGENEDPSWAPDGRHLVFTSTRSGVKQLWIVDAQSGATRQLTNAAGAAYPAWSPRLAYRP